MADVGIDIDYDAARNTVNDIDGMFDKLDDSFASPNNDSIVEADIKYFNDLNKYVSSLTETGRGKTEVALAYIDELANMNDTSEVDDVENDGSEATDDADLAEEDNPIDTSTESNETDEVPPTIDDVAERAEELHDNGKMSDDSLEDTQEAVDKAKDLHDSGKMSDDSLEDTASVIDTAEDLLDTNKIGDDTYDHTIETVIHAENLLDTDKIGDDTYDNVINTIGTALGLVGADKIGEDTLNHVLDTTNKAMDLVDSGKIGEDTLNHVLDTENKAMGLVDSGKIGEDTLNHVLDTTDKALNLVDTGKIGEDTLNHVLDVENKAMDLVDTDKIGEDTLNHVLDTTSKALDLVEAGKVGEDVLNNILDLEEKALDLVESGKMTEEELNNFLDTIDNVLDLVESGQLDEGSLLTTIYTLHHLLEELDAGKINGVDFNNYLIEIQKLLKALKNGEIDIDTYNKLIRDLLAKLGVNNEVSVAEIKENLNITRLGEDIISNIEALGTDVPDNSDTNIVDSNSLGINDEKTNASNNDTLGFFGDSSIIGSGVDSLKDKVDDLITGSGDKNFDFGILALGGGAAAGGLIGKGVYANSREKYIKFGPEDWDRLSIEKKSVIERIMTKVGFDSFSFNDFKKANFKVLKERFDELKNYLKISVKQNVMIRNELLRLYRFDVFEEDNIIDYLLFIMMIIDGKSLFDEYNFVRTISKFDVEENDIIYDGLSIIECIDS